MMMISKEWMQAIGTGVVVLAVSITLAIQERYRRKKHTYGSKFIPPGDEVYKILCYSRVNDDVLEYGLQIKDTIHIVEVNGEKYLLERDSDGYYVYDSDHGEVEDELLRLLPSINNEIEIYYLLKEPKDPYWNLRTLYRLCYNTQQFEDETAELNAMLFKWYFYTEREHLDPSFPKRRLREYCDPFVDTISTGINMDLSEELWNAFPGSARYLFFTGWVAAATPSFFRLPEGGALGRHRMLQAHHAEPNNPLYKWAVSQQLGLTSSEVRSLAQQVDETYFAGLEPFVANYFIDMLQGDALMKH